MRVYYARKGYKKVENEAIKRERMSERERERERERDIEWQPHQGETKFA